MRNLNVALAVTLTLELGFLVDLGQFYVIPNPTIEALSPRGLRVSIPATDGVQLFAFHGNVNKNIRPTDVGEISGDIYRAKNGRWSFEDSSVLLRQGDVLNYWLYVQANGKAHQTREMRWSFTTDTHDEVKVNTRVEDATLIFEENFNSLNKSVWEREVKIPSIPDYEFCVFHNDYNLNNVEVEDGVLRIMPTILEDIYGENATVFGKMELSECSSMIPEECSRQAASFNILPPIISGRLTTKTNFHFKFGKIEIRAKFPQGDWLYPEMWLVPRYSTYGADYLSGRILLGQSRGNQYLVNLANVSDVVDSRKLEFGIRSGPTLNVREETVSRFASGNSRWTEDFHIYTTIWSSEGFTFLVDNEEVGRLQPGPEHWLHGSNIGAATPISPFDQEFYISLGLGVGGVRVFPDNTTGSGYLKPWKNSGAKAMLKFWHSRNHWLPSWTNRNGKKTAFEVDYIRIWSV